MAIANSQIPDRSRLLREIINRAFMKNKSIIADSLNITQFNCIDDRILVIAHQFSIDNLVDPDISAIAMIEEWTNSSSGRWLISRGCRPPIVQRTDDIVWNRYIYQIGVMLSGAAVTEYYLRASLVVLELFFFFL